MSTAKRRKQFPVYETLLHLYPKSFRSEYGEQMVQTLADMLDDSHDKRERTAVWLRVASELPLSVMSEVTNSLGGATMNRLTKISNKQLLIAGLTVLVLLVVSVFTLARRPVMQTIANTFYSKSTRQMLVLQDKTLGGSFHTSDARPPQMQGCAMAGVSLITTRVVCLAGVERTDTLGNDESDKMNAIQHAQAIDTALQNAGYKLGQGGASTVELIEDIYRGEDQSTTPGSFYEKATGPYVCFYNMKSAYSKPFPKVVSSSLSCIRTAYLLGTPFGEPSRKE